MIGILKRAWHSLSDFGKRPFDHSSSGLSIVNRPQYPSEPPTVSLSLSLSSNTCLPGEEVYLHLSVFNETAFPLTLGKYSWSILAITRSARMVDCCMIEMRDTETCEELPRIPYICVGGELMITTDYEKSFLTILAFSAHVVKGFLVKHDELKPGHVYVIKFSNLKLPWWQYGTKEEVLMPGTEEEEEIRRRTGKNPCVNYEAYKKDPYYTEPELNIKITGQPPRLTCL
jgi:hypothetical protein